jgi:hypothetical protein
MGRPEKSVGSWMEAMMVKTFQSLEAKPSIKLDFPTPGRPQSKTGMPIKSFGPGVFKAIKRD